MEQFTRISIDGTAINQFSSLSVTQSIFDHHAFRLVCPSESIDGKAGSLFNSSKEMIGGNISIRVKSMECPGEVQFTGVVTQVEAARYQGHAGDIVISGFSPTILLDNGPHCKSWRKKTLNDIADDVLKHFPQNLFQPSIAPMYKEILSYTVQYNETAWQFLSRMSTHYGEWLFYNGKELVIGQPRGDKATLVYGSNLPEFNMAVQVRPAGFQAMGRDYINHAVYNSKPNGIADKAGLNELGQHALQKSEKFYSTQPKQWQNHFLTEKKQIDDFVNTRASMQASNMIRFNGSSVHPGIQLGGSVTVNGKNIFNKADESIGDYTVISINHHCDGQGNYGNNFIAIPATVKHPPVTVYAEPHCETQSAIVTDNNDTGGLGRVCVKFHWMNGSEKSPWLRIASAHGGDGKGMFFIPEKDEHVIVGFEGDNPAKPYIIGTVYHGKAKNQFSTEGNDIKTIQTRSGNKVVMNDKEGSVFVEDKDGNSMLIDGAGNITLKSNKTVLIDAKDEITLKSKKISLIAEDEIDLESKILDGKLSNEAKLAGKNLVEITSDNKINVASNNEVAVSGTTKASVSGLQTEINGTSQATIQGAMVKLNC